MNPYTVQRARDKYRRYMANESVGHEETVGSWARRSVARNPYENDSAEPEFGSEDNFDINDRAEGAS